MEKVKANISNEELPKIAKKLNKKIDDTVTNKPCKRTKSDVALTRTCNLQKWEITRTRK